MTSDYTIQIAISIITVLIYVFLMLGYELWLWKKGMDSFREWLGKKLGYPIRAIAGFRSISWKIDSKAPVKTKIFLMIVSNAFILLSGMVPIFLLALVTLLMFLAISFFTGG